MMYVMPCTYDRVGVVFVFERRIHFSAYNPGNLQQLRERDFLVHEKEIIPLDDQKGLVSLTRVHFEGKRARIVIPLSDESYGHFICP